MALTKIQFATDNINAMSCNINEQDVFYYGGFLNDKASLFNKIEVPIKDIIFGRPILEGNETTLLSTEQEAIDIFFNNDLEKKPTIGLSNKRTDINLILENSLNKICTFEDGKALVENLIIKNWVTSLISEKSDINVKYNYINHIEKNRDVKFDGLNFHYITLIEYEYTLSYNNIAYDYFNKIKYNNNINIIGNTNLKFTVLLDFVYNNEFKLIGIYNLSKDYLTQFNGNTNFRYTPYKYSNNLLNKWVIEFIYNKILKYEIFDVYTNDQISKYSIYNIYTPYSRKGIESFSVAQKSDNTLILIYKYIDGEQVSLEFDTNNWINYDRNLTSNKSLPKIYTVNPEIVVLDSNDGTAYPIAATNSKNAISISSISNGDDSITYKTIIYNINNQYKINISYKIDDLSLNGSITKDINKLDIRKKINTEHTLCAFNYTDSSTITHYILNIMIDEYVYSLSIIDSDTIIFNEFNKNNVVLLDQFNYSTDDDIIYYKLFNTYTFIHKYDITDIIPESYFYQNWKENEFSIVLTYMILDQAKEVTKYIKDGKWKVYLYKFDSTPIDQDIIPIDLKSPTVVLNNQYKIKFNISSDTMKSIIEALDDTGDLQLLIQGIDGFNIPYTIITEGSIDSRDIDLGNVEVEYDGNTYPVSYTSPASGIIHTTRSKLLSNTFKITATGLTDNLMNSRIIYYTDNSNYNKIGKGSLFSINYENANLFIVDGIDSKIFLNNNIKQPYIIRGLPSKPSISQSGSLSNGLVEGVKVIVTNKINNNQDLYLPILSVYDEHLFIAAKISTTINIIEIDEVIDTAFNVLSQHNKFYIPDMNSTNLYRFSFNLRIAPNCINSTNNKFTINYELGTDLDNRISSPLIKEWFILGYVKDSLNIEKSITDNKKIVNNKYSDYSYTNYDISDCYLSNDSINTILSNKDDAVWCSGYYTTPSGYVDLNDVNFTNDINGVITDGIIRTNTYNIYLVVRDVNDNLTGLDLIHISERSGSRVPVVSTDFNY